MSEDFKSFPALAVTIALFAQETAGPWSASKIRIVFINSHPYSGRSFFSHRFDTT
jgi:hypothetical protein